jgi:hypothetical protein
MLIESCENAAFVTAEMNRQDSEVGNREGTHLSVDSNSTQNAAIYHRFALIICVWSDSISVLANSYVDSSQARYVMYIVEGSLHVRLEARNLNPRGLSIIDNASVGLPLIAADSDSACVGPLSSIQAGKNQEKGPPKSQAIILPTTSPTSSITPLPG